MNTIPHSTMRMHQPTSGLLLPKQESGSHAERGTYPADRLTLSPKAQVLGSTLASQQSMSSEALAALHTSSWEAVVEFARKLGSGSPDLLSGETETPADTQRARQAVAYALSLRQPLTDQTRNPFMGKPRVEVSAAVYGDSSAYTEAERFAAARELVAQDLALATTLLPGEPANETWRQGLLDHVHGMLPVELLQLSSGQYGEGGVLAKLEHQPVGQDGGDNGPDGVKADQQNVLLRFLSELLDMAKARTDALSDALTTPELPLEAPADPPENLLEVRLPTAAQVQKHG